MAMHELSVARALLRQVERVAHTHGVDAASGAVRGVNLRVGALSGIEPDLLARAFPEVARGGLAQGAALSIEMVPVRVRCDDCGAESAVAANRLVCPVCASARTRLVAGDELLLVSLDLEKADDV